MKVSRTLLLCAGLAVALLFPRPGLAEGPTCALLGPADLGDLLGGAAVAKPNGGACQWTAPGSAKRLIAARIKARGPGAEMAYAGARSNAGKEGAAVVTDLTGIGDKAFAVQASFGVALFTMKAGKILELQYLTGGAGTLKDVEALRPVARKAAAAL
jgi:hypothetical protein